MAKHIPLRQIFFVLALAGLSCQNCQNTETLLPEKLYNLQRTDFLQGTDAERFVNRLHLNSVVATKSEIAFYEGKQERLTIYISYFGDKDNAQNEMQKMIEKIQTTETVFKKGKTFLLDGVNLFRCFGMGQSHYIFTQSEKLFWVSVNTMIAADFISYYLNRVKSY